MSHRRFSQVILSTLLIGAYPHLAQSESLTLSDDVISREVPRYGLNLGGSGQWGAEQLRTNILNNPGFEPILDRTIFIVGKKGFHNLTDDNNWLARENGFWSHGTYHVLTGGRQGEQGNILDSLKNRNNEAEIFIEKKTDAFSNGDVIVLSRQSDLNTPYGWRVLQGQVLNEREDLPTDSGGKQALRIISSPVLPAELVQYFDNIDDRAGELLPVNGAWQLTFKAKALSANATLHVHFDRGGKHVFLDQTVALGPDWQQYTVRFDAQDSPAPGVLTFSIDARSGDLLLDDAYLGAAESGVAGFRKEVVSTLKQLKPGYLRDWQGQLGDTFVNRIANEYSHQPVRYRPGEYEVQHHYSLDDFLSLCHAIGADPWVVAPTTLSADEWQNIGRYLKVAADKYRFKSILVEYGNENWNPLFRPGGILDPSKHAEAADQAIIALQAGSQHDPRIKPLLNAQFANPGSPEALAGYSHQATRIAVAPYFFFRLNHDESPENARTRALSDSGELFLQEAASATRQGKKLLVYEVNLHTTLGDAPASLRNMIATSGISGVALARRLIQGTLAGIEEQAVYSFSGFDTYQENGKGLVRLWGITRDLTRSGYFRPTGLALQMLNQITGGEVRALHCQGAQCGSLTGVAFAKQRFAIVSAAAEAIPLSLPVSCATTSYKTQVLYGEDLTRNNEDSVNVQIQTIPVSCNNTGQLSVRIPAFSFMTISPGPVAD